MKVTWFGTASIALETLEGRLLFDPFFPLKGADARLPEDAFDGYTDIFLTHGHFDHIVHIPGIVRRNPGVRIWCTETPARVLVTKGVPEKQITRVRPGDTLSVNGFSIRVFHGKHAVLPKIGPARILRILTSPHRSNLPFMLRENRICREADETLFYHIEAEGRTVSLIGSLNLRDEVTYPTGSDLLLLPYNGWDDNLPPAINAVERLKPKAVLLHHWDVSFPPLTEPLDLSPLPERYGEMVQVIRQRESIEL